MYCPINGNNSFLPFLPNVPPAWYGRKGNKPPLGGVAVAVAVRLPKPFNGNIYFCRSLHAKGI